MGKYNKLKNETSPYLQQHANNPVNWYPWSEEAFEKAQEKNLPIFLSIGYSTCHWCHVMERESFSNKNIADLINDNFVPIKVDREERPDIDSLYMTVCQQMTGSGGWPLTIFLTPDKKPFFAATYLPPERRHGRRGIVEIINEVGRLWREDNQKIKQVSLKIINNLKKENKKTIVKKPKFKLLKDSYRYLRDAFDTQYGGFGQAPKFPMANNLIFLLHYWKRTGENQPLKMVEKTLIQIRKGGIYDQLGFGFHRYAVDKKWLIPHFEKMLYDQALLLYVYGEIYQVTGKKQYLQIIREIVTYLKRSLRSLEGGFYTAEDADSEGEEGKYYRWSKNELERILSKSEFKKIIEIYNVEKDKNNILHLSQIKDLNKVSDVNKKLFKNRQKRIPPLLDDKILTDWNGLTIAALAKVGWILADEEIIKLARTTVDFIENNIKNSRLFHSYRNGVFNRNDHLNDYSFFLWGLIELYQATLDEKYLKLADDIAKVMINLFYDQNNGGFFFTSEDNSDIPIREKKVYDGAIPSGNSLATLSLIKLTHLTDNLDYKEITDKSIKYFSEDLKSNPMSSLIMLIVVDYLENPFSVLKIQGIESASAKKLLTRLREEYLPSVLIRKDGKNEQNFSTVICEGYKCGIPIDDIEKIIRKIKK